MTSSLWGGGLAVGSEGAISLEVELDPGLDEPALLFARFQAAGELRTLGSYTVGLRAEPVAVHCEDDEREPDSPPDSPTELRLGVLPGEPGNPAAVEDGVLCPEDRDHFMVKALSGGELLLVELRPGPGQPMPQLVVKKLGTPMVPLDQWEEQELSWIMVANPSMGDLEVVISEPQRGGGPAEGLPYSLSLTRGGACEDEEESELAPGGNDDLEHAADAPGQEGFFALACALDPDVFRFLEPPGTQIFMHVDPDDAAGDLRVQLLDGEGNLLAEDQSSPYELDTIVATDQADPREIEELFLGIEVASGVAVPYEVIVHRNEPRSLSQIQEQIFGPRCAGCHDAGAGHRSGLFLNEVEASYHTLVEEPAATHPGAGGWQRVLPHVAEQSFLIEKLVYPEATPGSAMPLAAPWAPLSNEQIDQIRTWILSGAPRGGEGEGEGEGEAPCDPMDVVFEDFNCDRFWGWAWDGETCVEHAGACVCAGDDCDNLYETEQACLEAFEHCGGEGEGEGEGEG